MPRAGLSRDKIINEAIQMVDQHGIEALSMRRLGEALGVEAMSLYRYVASKADLLDAVHAKILQQMSAPTLGGNWYDDLHVLARSLREVLRQHPRALPLFVSRPVLNQGSLDFVECVLAMFREAGLASDEALHALHTVVTYVVGHCLQHQEPASAHLLGQGLEAIDAQLYPHIARLQGAIAAHDPEREFEFGIEVLLGGLGARLPPRALSA